MKKVTRPYEILVRFSPGGRIASHVANIEDIIDDDGTVIASRPQGPTPLSLAGPEFDAVMKFMNGAILAERDALSARCAVLEDEVAQLKKPPVPATPSV